MAKREVVVKGDGCHASDHHKGRYLGIQRRAGLNQA